MMKILFSKKNLWCIFLLTIMIRLISLGLYPLMDTTEARYGEIARIMLESNNWLTPQFDYEIPFWGKPPLATWITAFSAKFLNVTEFALRFPHWLAGVSTLLFMAFFSFKTKINTALTLTIISTTVIFILSSGAIMTDMALTFSFTLSMLAFYLSWYYGQHEQKSERNKFSIVWAYISFFGLGLGLLTKGPLVLIIMGLAVVPFLITQHGVIDGIKSLWQRFPFFSGIGLMLLVALPWYIMAEIATPGFLDYFIVGEHFKRFLISGWEGDLYGSAHDQPLGMIWLFWLLAVFPWSFAFIYLLWSKRGKLKEYSKNPLFVFSLCWVFSPVILFTFSANILSSYVLPGVPALGILINLLIDKNDYKWLMPTFFVTPVLLLIALPIVSTFVGDSKSDKAIFEHLCFDIPIYYFEKRPFSGQFYSKGQAKVIYKVEELEESLEFYLIGNTERVKTFIEENSLDCMQEYKGKSKRTLYLCNNSLQKGSASE